MDDAQNPLFWTGLGDGEKRTPEQYWGQYVTRATKRLMEGKFRESSRMMQPEGADYDIIVEVRKQNRYRPFDYDREILTPAVARGLLWRLPRLVWEVFWDAVGLLGKRKTMRAMYGIGHMDDEGITHLSITTRLFREDG